MGFLGTYAGTFSDVSLMLEIFVTLAFFSGYFFARKRQISRHYRMMVFAFMLDVSFMVSYMVKSLIEGHTKFGGPVAIKMYIYYPVVAFHSIISIVVLLLAGFMVYHGFTRTEKSVDSRKMVREVARHHRMGKITLFIWILSFLSGILVYLLLYVLYRPL